MKKNTIFLVIAIGLIVFGGMVFTYLSKNNNVQEEEKGIYIPEEKTAMTQELCEKQKGTWNKMEITRDFENGGDVLFYECICPDEITRIKEGEEKTCK